MSENVTLLKLCPECPYCVGVEPQWRPDLIIECESCGNRLTLTEWLEQDDCTDDDLRYV